MSYLFGFENLQEERRLVQRAIDISYFPSALLVNGHADGPLEELQQRLIEDLDRDRFDFHFRFTWSFDIKDSQT